MNTFEHQLAFGKAGESLIANWLKGRGYSILPVYEKEISEGKGPQVFTVQGNLVAPDLLIFGRENSKVWWIEAKHKSAFSWHRISRCWVTGIDLRHYQDYLRIRELSPWPVWLLFLQREGVAKDTPPNKISPTGLYGGSLAYLEKRVNHSHDNWGRSGMIYWAEKTLTKIATLEDILRSS